MTNRGRRSSEPNDELIDLSDEEIERRLSGGAGLGSVTERAPKPAAKPRRQRGRSGGGGLLFRDVGLVLVLLLFLGAGANFVLNPAHAENSPTPGSSEVAVGPSASAQPTATLLPTPTPIGLPSEVTPSLLNSPTPTPIPTATPEPTPTLAPGQTPKPTPKPTPNTTATLRVYMNVINDDGGLASANNWTVTVTGAGANPHSFPGPVAGFQTVTVLSGTKYSITASGVSGYTKTPSGDCSGPLAAGSVGLCTIDQNDRQASVEVKTVVQTGAASSGDFDVVVTANHVSPTSAPGDSGGFPYSFDANAPFSVSVSNLNGYSLTPSGACSGNGVGGATLVCTIYLNSGAAPITGSGPAPGPLAWAVWLPLVLPRRRRSPGR